MVDQDERDQKPSNQQVYEALLAQGVQEELARELAAECGPDTEIEVGGEGERTLAWPGSRPAAVTLAPRKAELEAHLLRKGTYLAEQSQPDEDGEPGDVEVEVIMLFHKPVVDPTAKKKPD